MSKILYLSYDGLLDPLGQSQILPYLEGLAGLTHSITIISFEKKSKCHLQAALHKRLMAKNIYWRPLRYHKHPLIASTVWDLLRMLACARKLIEEKKIDVIHARSYLPAIVAMKLKQQKEKTPFIFDTRGFWIDERIEGKIWNPKNPIFKLVINYLRKQEKQLFAQAESTIVLTEKAKFLLANSNPAYSNPEKTQAIPCCVDTELFSQSTVPLEIQNMWRSKLKIGESNKVIVYHGSWGSWYLTKQMLDFMSYAANRDPDYFILIITPDHGETILKEAMQHNIPLARVAVYSASRNEIPELLSIASLALFFIYPVFSKQASSPTKLGEIVSMSLPLITNKGVGDNDQLLDGQLPVFLVKSFSYREYELAIDFISKDRKHTYSQSLIEYFSLARGIQSYDEIYRKLAN